MTRYLRRPGRWLRRTRYALVHTLSDIGLRGADPASPVWLRDNPFLVKASRAETRRLGLSLRLMTAVLVLSGLLLGGLWAERAYAGILTGMTRFLFGTAFPPALFIVLTFFHTTLIGNTRSALAVSPGDEARRGTLPDLLLTPLRRAEMLLAMGVGPARTAFLVALAGLPLYLLMGEMGALSARDILALYVLFALMCYAPPVYAIPALAGSALTPETALGQAQISRSRRTARPNAFGAVGIYAVLSFLFLGQVLGAVRGGWLGHLMAALHIHFTPAASFFLFFAWPYYAVQILGDRLDFFHASLSPLLFVLPLQALSWLASALSSAAALSAGDAAEMARLPQNSRARTVARWTARAAGLCALGVVWKAWVESGDTAALAGGSFGTGHAGGWDAAGLLLLLGGLSLPNVCTRALAVDELRPTPAAGSFFAGAGPSLLGKRAGGRRVRPLLPTLRRAFKRAHRPLAVAAATFLLACALGGLSPFATPVYRIAGEIALAGAATILWAVGVRRLLPVGAKTAPLLLLYGLPAVALSLPGGGSLAALSPASAWVRLFPDGPGLLARFPFWHVAAPPSLEVCLAGTALAGLALIGAGRRAPLPAPIPGEGGRRGTSLRGAGASPPRNTARTAALMAWITARTDNPLFTYEMRTRTRSGRWADGWIFVGAGLLAALIMGVAYPDITLIAALLSPFHFFVNSAALGRIPPPGLVWAGLGSLLLAAQCWALGFRGQIIGEGLIARDRQRGIWGFLLLTPLTARDIFWGKLAGQTAGPGAVWAVCSLGSLLLYALAAPAVGLGPALLVWGIGQVFIAALFLLGVGLGAALSTYPVFSRGLRGASGLLFTAVVGLGLWGQFQLLPFDALGGWMLMAGRLLLGSGYALALAAPLFWFAEWRVAALRRRDIAVGDGVE